MANVSVNERVRRHREVLRSQGLRPVQIWVPDTRRAGFAEECRRQSLLVRNDAEERDVLDWLDTVADRDAWR